MRGDRGERADDTFFRDLIDLRRAYYKAWRANEPAVPKVLFHYTDPAGAIGILRSGVLWATSAFHLNDETELIYAASCFRQVIRHRMVRAETPEERLLFRPQLCSFDMTRPDGLHFFTASLSASADSLPQWQAYGSGGYGVALGFDGPELLKVTLRDNLVPGFGIGLTRVIYDNADQRSWFEYSVDEWFSRAAEVVVATRGRILNQGWLLSGLFSHLLTCTSEYFPSIKAAHFRHENEWRLGHGHLASVGADIVRRRGEKSVPYIELDLRVSGKLPLVSFTLGPGFRSEAALHTFRKLVAQLQYEHVPVASSEIPLRIEQREWAVQ